MLNKNDYAILSLPAHNKHFVLKTDVKEKQLTLNVDNTQVNATITAICDSFRESMIVVNNLTGE